MKFTPTSFGPLPKETSRLLRDFISGKNCPVLLKRPLKKDERIAYVSTARLGDTIMFWVTINNLKRNGYNVEVIGNYPYSLRQWFPDLKIHPLPKLEDQQQLAAFDTVLHADTTDLSRAMSEWHPHSTVLWREPLYRMSINMVDIQLLQCKYQLGLDDLSREPSITPPQDLVFRKYKNRVMIHTTAIAYYRQWPPKKFIKLAQMLMSRGYDPQFIVAPEEHNKWEKIVDGKVPLPKFSSLSDVASCLYESSFFIGNDSGIGHLANSLRVPTLSIIIRYGKVRQWRPAWGGEIVVSPSWLNPKPLKDLLWKYFTSVSRVLKGFDRLVANTK